MYTTGELIAQIEAVYDELDKCQGRLLSARLAKDGDGEIRALRELEGLVIGVQQELTVIYGFLKESDNESE